MALETGYIQEVLALIERLQPLLPTERPEPARWILTPDGDLGNEWCFDCGRAKARNLRRHNRKRREEYILDGGWRIESDNFPFCAGCSKRLDASPTDYCIVETIHHFETCGFSTNTQDDALDIEEMLDYYDYRHDDAPATEERRSAVIKIATAFIAQHESN